MTAVDPAWLTETLATAPATASPARAARLRTLLATTAAPAASTTRAADPDTERTNHDAAHSAATA